MIGGITNIIVGIICIVIGIINAKGNISALHSYHTKNIKEEDIKPFGKLMGLGMIIVGSFLIISGVFLAITEKTGNTLCMTLSTVFMVIGFVIGLPICLYAIKKYNKSFFG